jgi:subfamily B ATP-binding cassette protein MsbA
VTTLRRLLRYYKPYLGEMVLAAVLLAIAGALNGVAIATFKPLTSLLKGEALDLDPGGNDVVGWFVQRLPVEEWTLWLAERVYVAVPVFLIVLFLIRGVLLYVGHYLAVRAGAKIVRDVRMELYASVTYQSQRFFLSHPTGLILSRILNDVSRIQAVSTTVLADGVRVLAMIPSVLFVIFYYNWQLSLVSMIALPALAYPAIRLGRRLRRAATRSQESLAEASVLLNETITGSRVVQGFTMERFEIGRFQEALRKLLRADLKAGRAQSLAPAIMEVVGALAGGALFFFAGYNIARGTLSVDDFLVVFVGLGTLFMSVRRLNQVNIHVQQALSAATRVFTMLDTEREVRDAPDAIGLPEFRESIRFENVSFAYADVKVLDGIDLTLTKGETVALVGSSGSGKTTLANLVPRFYDVTGGRVTIDGHDIRKVTLESLRSQMGLVTQETFLFDESVRNNISYGRADISEDKVFEAARAAHAYDFIQATPDGFETRLGERGMRLSMGQRQRIAIARALLKDPPILILDEATSALDAESETLVQEALETLMQGRTSIVIAHRLATVRRVDRIVVLDGGKIVEVGTHRELLDRGGVYAHLHDLQFQES